MILEDCVFCSRAEQPPALFEADTVYAMPDKFPLTPGHALVISKDHLACYGAGTSEVWRDLEESATTVRRFLAESYGCPVLVWENGVSGQSVFHAHLHLIPLPLGDLHFDPATDRSVAPITGWAHVGERYLRDGSYRYLQILDRRYLLPGFSPVLRDLRRWVAASTGLRLDPNGWIKTTTPDDVEEVRRRWAEWRRAGHTPRPPLRSPMERGRTSLGAPPSPSPSGLGEGAGG